MNNYGLVLNEVGMRASFDAILLRFLAPLGALFFGKFSYTYTCASFR